MPETSPTIVIDDVRECIAAIIRGSDQRLDVMDPRTQLVEGCGSVADLIANMMGCTAALFSSSTAHDRSIRVERPVVAMNGHRDRQFALDPAIDMR